MYYLKCFCFQKNYVSLGTNALFKIKVYQKYYHFPESFQVDMLMTINILIFEILKECGISG